MTLYPYNLRRWHIVAFAVAVMIGSGLLGHFLVSHNEAALRGLRQEAGWIEERINAQWQTAARFERNAGYAVVVSMLSRLEKSDTRWKLEILRDDFIKHLLPGVEADTDIHSLKQLMEQAEANRDQAIDTVNALYSDRLHLVQRMSALEADNRFLASLALFMQLLGLVLIILSREMDR